MRTKKITVGVTLSAGIHKAWDLWTSPGHVVKWNSASKGWHCPKAENDLRPGGKFKYRMASSDEKVSFDFEGVYLEVIDQKEIAYSISDGRKVTVEFENLGNQSKVTETFEAEEIHPEEIQRAGWQAILNNFKKYVETQPGGH
jgi:uncharacterized protein YndB with AHSA1/START domain